MREDIIRVLLVGFIAVLAGIIFGHTLIWLCLGLFYLLFVIYRDLHQFLLWMNNPKDVEPPDAIGVLDQLYRAADARRKRNKTRKKQLSRYLKRFKKATAALPDATIILGDENEIQWGNKPAREILGIKWPQDAGQRIDNLIRHPELGQIIGNDINLQQTVEIPSPIDPDIQLSIQVVPYGKAQRLFIARDITELTRSNRMRSDFVANVSHELRTPLTIIGGYLESLLDNTEDRQLHKQLGTMQQQAHRMQDIVSDLLLLSRLEQHEKQPSFETVIVSEMLGKIHREAMRLSGEKDHVFYLEAEADLFLHGNHSELYSAFSNLVSNAVKYTPARGVIRIIWYSDKYGAHMLVKDTGQGIPAIHLPRLTERFYRVDRGRARSEGGTGLGLAIVKHVLNRHGAELHVDSVMGQGSSFRCDFPASSIVRQAESDSISQK